MIDNGCRFSVVDYKNSWLGNDQDSWLSIDKKWKKMRKFTLIILHYKLSIDNICSHQSV